MQLRDFGIHILTTEASDRSDDDSFEGQATRLRKGLKAEEEVIDMVSRSRNGRRQKALGDPDEKILPQVVGNGTRRYGYKFIRNNKGTVIGYELNYDIIHKELNGTEWTEVKVVRFIFESVANGVSLRKLTEILNEKGIPTPYTSKGLRMKNMTENPRWQHRGLSGIIKDTTYYGELHYGKTKNAEAPGRKRSLRQKTSPEEQIIVPVPAIVTRELWEKANRQVPINKTIATRNNKYSKDCLLRGGFVRCAYCGYALTPRPKPYIRASGELWANFYYECRRIIYLKDGKCPGCLISVDHLDNAVIEYVKKLLQDPSKVDKEIKRLLAKNQINKRQQQKIEKLKQILNEQETLRANLSREMKKKDLSEKTVALLGRDLADLEQQEQEARKDLTTQQQAQQKRNDLALRLTEFHKQCQEWRKELDIPELIPHLNRFYQEAVIFFGITVKVWRKYDKEQYYEIYTRPPTIVEPLSLMTDRD
ncbi:MAG TPA: recombinase family protein [Ktedonobacteraceae bacterium]